MKCSKFPVGELVLADDGAITYHGRVVDALPSCGASSRTVKLLLVQDGEIVDLDYHGEKKVFPIKQLRRASV